MSKKGTNSYPEYRVNFLPSARLPRLLVKSCIIIGKGASVSGTHRCFDKRSIDMEPCIERVEFELFRK